MRAVCFDLDDTLYDYRCYARGGLRRAADHLEARVGKRYHRELHALYFGEGVTDGTFDRLVERHDLPPGVVDGMVEAFHGEPGRLEPYPGARAVLSRLAGDHRLGLVTDGRGGHAKLRRLDIREFFDAVVVTPRHDSSKRDPAMFERALVDLGVDARATTYVGDDPRVDFRVPNELGMRTVRLRRGRYVDLDPPTERDVPDHEIGSLRELLALVRVETGERRRKTG